MLITNAYAQAGNTVTENNWFTFIPLILMFAALYFFMLRPQMKKQKELRQMLNNLVVGDEVVTAGGLLGKITRITGPYVVLEIADGVSVKLQKSTITTVLPQSSLQDI